MHTHHGDFNSQFVCILDVQCHFIPQEKEKSDKIKFHCEMLGFERKSKIEEKKQNVTVIVA